MTNYREILRLDSLGLNKTQIAESLGCSRTTVIHVLRQAEASCISYPLPEGMSDKALSEKLYPPSETKPVFRMPDYEQIHKELQRNGVTLMLLWLEYCEQCRLAGELPYCWNRRKKYFFKISPPFLLSKKREPKCRLFFHLKMPTSLPAYSIVAHL